MHKTTEVKIGNLTFDCRVAGNVSDELIILLHGFPETSIMWTKLMEKLASTGYCCVAPDMRGYSKNACPKGAKHYTTAKLAQDVINIADAFRKDRFHLVGHDWGAMVGWHVVNKFAKGIVSWSALSVPHPRAFARAYKTDKEQQKKSGYIKWFLIPFLPELFLRRNDFSLFRRLWKRSNPEELAHYLSVFRIRKCLTGALNYYRANLARGVGEKVGDINTSTLFIWGSKDFAVGARAAEGNHELMKGDYTYLEVEGGHWLIQSNYEEVEEAVVAHVSKHGAH